MRIVYCSAYLERREADAYANVDRLQAQIAHPGLVGRLRLLIGSPSAALQRQREQLHEGMVAAARLTKGRAGEQLLIDKLARRLDDRYLLFYSYPGRALDSGGGDADGVLVGPHGVTIYEVKAWNGLYQASDNGWKHFPYGDQRWEPAHANPNRQALRHAAGMQTLLRQQGMTADIVYPTVAIAAPRMHVDVAPPMSVSLIDLVAPRLTLNELLGTRSPATLTATQVGKIEKTLLTRLAVGKRKIVTLPRGAAEQAPARQFALPLLGSMSPLALVVLAIVALIVLACLGQALLLLLQHH